MDGLNCLPDSPLSVLSLRSGRYRNPSGASFTINIDTLSARVVAVYGGHYYLEAVVSKIAAGSFDNEKLTLSGINWGSKSFIVRDSACLEEIIVADLGKKTEKGNIERINRSNYTKSQTNGSSIVLWTHVERNRRVLEAAIITNTDSVAEKNRISKMMHRSFRNRTRTFPVFKWGAVESKVNLECPTEKQTAPVSHTPSKIVGTTLAHTRIWQDFYRRHKLNNPEDYILIFEGDATCSVVDCGSYAIEQLKASTADFIYLGWCYMNNTEASLASLYLNSTQRVLNISASEYAQRVETSYQILPPVCLHAYALSVRAARFLFNNVYPCANAFGDWQVKSLATQGKLAWNMAVVPNNAVSADLKGPRQTKGLWVQDW